MCTRCAYGNLFPLASDGSCPGCMVNPAAGIPNGDTKFDKRRSLASYSLTVDEIYMIRTKDGALPPTHRGLPAAIFDVLSRYSGGQMIFMENLYLLVVAWLDKPVSVSFTSFKGALHRNHHIFQIIHHPDSNPDVRDSEIEVYTTDSEYDSEVEHACETGAESGTDASSADHLPAEPYPASNDDEKDEPMSSDAPHPEVTMDGYRHYLITHFNSARSEYTELQRLQDLGMCNGPFAASMLEISKQRMDQIRSHMEVLMGPAGKIE